MRVPKATRIALFATIAALCICAVSRAADATALRSLFPSEADLFIDGPGLVRVDLTPEIIAQCRPDLSNVRLFDRDGNEVPFLLDTPRRGVSDYIEQSSVRPLELSRDEVRRTTGPPLRREIYEIDMPARPPRYGSWSLMFDLTARSFVAKVEVQPLAGGESSRGSIFRLSAPRSVEKLRVPLPRGASGRLRVVFEHEEGFWLEPTFFTFESSAKISFGSVAAVPLTVLSSSSEGGWTTVDVARPRGLVPEAIRIATATPTFDRTVTINDTGPARSSAPLGAAKVFRLRPEMGVEELEIPTRPGIGDSFRVRIENGDSPPLADLTFAAVFAKPSLVASLDAPGGAAPAAVLRFGGDRARVPRYDIAGLLGQPGRDSFGRRAEALLQLYDPATIGAARLGPVRANAAFDPSPALAFAMRAGAEIDPRLWTIRRQLTVPASAEGLSRVRLSPEDLAALRPDLGDLRIIDDSSRQWPYLLDREVAAADVALTIAAPSNKDRSTIYRLEAPVGAFIVDQLRFEFDAPFYDRAFRLTGTSSELGQTLVTEGQLHRMGGDPTGTLVEFPPAEVHQFDLTVDNGDDAPLALRTASMRVHVSDVYLTAPAGTYWMLLGGKDATAPSYEVERVRDVVLAVEAVPVKPSAIEDNPRRSAAARLVKGKGREQLLLWVVVIAAVVVLAALTLRLARREQA